MIVASLNYKYGLDPSGNQLVTVTITCSDSATGMPTNGNNIVVDYTETIGGLAQYKQATIPGLALMIYSGSYDYAFDFWQITNIGNVPNPAPPVAQCDLRIGSINITKSESAPGANDAIINVAATSSYLPIQYSLDGVTFQSSNIFTGLGGGLKTVYCTDSNPLGCNANKTVVIPVLTNLLVKDPSVTIGGKVSRWNAAFNPIVFQYQRQDFEVTSVTNDSSTSKANLTVNGNVGKVGEVIYVHAGPYVGSFAIISVSSNTMVIDTPYTANASGYVNINSQKPNYKIITNIAYVDPLTGISYTITAKNSPAGNGMVKTNLAPFLQSMLQAIDKSDYTAVNYRDINLSASYRISYYEHWEDGTDAGHSSAVVTLADTYYVTYTARQLGQIYGGNMAEFVPFKAQAAKWVTDFKEPTYSTGFPFDMSFLYGEDLAGEQLYYKITLLDINRQPVAGNVLSSFLLNENGSFLLNTDGSKLIISQVTLANTPIVEHVGLNRLLIDLALTSDIYFLKIGLFYNDGTEKQVLSDQIIKVDQQCAENEVYLRWIGLTGSWNYFKFIYNQEVSLDVQNSTIVTRYVEDWEKSDTQEDVINKNASPKMQVHAEDMTVDDIKGCQSMKFSPKVQMCTSKSPAKWQTVVLNTATFSEYETNLDKYQFAVTFNLPSINIQNQ